jgi:hypothetical protein
MTYTKTLSKRIIVVHHDNRDMKVIPNYQPRSKPSFYAQTRLFDKEPGVRITSALPLLSF